MNRASKGLEAFVSYSAQNEPRFKVFDWAQSNPWQIDIPWSQLGNYLEVLPAIVHGQSYQVLSILNNTLELSSGQWRNEAWLWNKVTESWDLIYRFDYAATLAQQAGGWTGSWGPVVETFQSIYENTNPMGALGIQVIGKNSSGAWDSWGLLSAANSRVRTDNKGFREIFRDANYAFGVDSYSP